MSFSRLGAWSAWPSNQAELSSRRLHFELQGVVLLQTFRGMQFRSAREENAEAKRGSRAAGAERKQGLRSAALRDVGERQTRH